MNGGHKRKPRSVRLPADDERWVRQHAAYTGEPVNAVLRRAVAAYRAQVEEAHMVTFGSPYDPGEISR